MKVKLINYTKDADKLVALAARVCYNKEGDIDKLTESLTPSKVEDMLYKLQDSPNHGTPWEHPIFTFSVEGVSIALLKQITRHRLCSFDVKSERYCLEDNFDYVVPESIASSPAAVVMFNRYMNDAQNAYNTLVNKYNIPREDARAVLPQSVCTSFVMTINLRNLLHFFNLRCCTRAQKEIRELSTRMLVLCKEKYPLLFKTAGPSCTTLGYCPEGSMSCGKKPTLDKVLKGYEGFIKGLEPKAGDSE